jgi:hypothetical protein
MTEDRLFTDEELEEMSRPTMERAIEAIDAGDLEKAKGLCRTMAKEGAPLHNLYLDWAASLLIFIKENFGKDQLQSALEYCASVWWKPVCDRAETAALENVIRGSARMMHAHFGSFSIEEDDEKFVIKNDPCGSGGRLLREGAYGPPKNFARIEEAGPMTFNRENFPVYCTHCAVIHQMMPIEWIGYPHPIMVPPEKPGDPCLHIIYKDPKKVPEEYYKAVGKGKE